MYSQEEAQLAIKRANDAMGRHNYGEADGIARDLYKQFPSEPWACGMMSEAVGRGGNLEESVDLLHKALAGNNSAHNTAIWHAHLAQRYLGLGELEKAIHHAWKGVPPAAQAWGKPEYRTASYGFMVLAMVQREAGDWDNARLHAIRSIAALPTNNDAHLLLAEILLAHFEWCPAWREYEFRNATGGATQLPPIMQFGSVPWSGYTPPRHTRMVVVSDQGFGDMIMFMRYLDTLRTRVPDMQLAVPPELLAFAKRSFGHLTSNVFSALGEVPQHDINVRLTSLPWALGDSGDPPLRAEPYVRLDPARTERFASLLRGVPHPRVGLCWRGRPTYANDRRRSCDLSVLDPLLHTGAGLVSLQKPLPDRDRGLAERTGMLDLASELDDFNDTAALIAGLDLVVGVDTGVMHLAAAMGKPTWILIPAHCDWRWGRGDSSEVVSPWYESVRLFRQHRGGGGWNEPVERVRAALCEEVAQWGTK